jgi:Tol biopolymer transport system component
MLFFIVASGVAQDKPKWDVNNPGGPFKDVSFTVKEGTWMNLDVSPDGKEILFDLLGDIYSMPITGGEAKLLRGGHAFQVQPRFSPDGKKILFTSDEGGGDNIWVMNRDGSGARQVTKESFRLLNNGAWSPDGEYIVARKHFTSGRSLGAGELWLYHISGGTGLQLTARKNDQQDLNEPSFSPNGQYIYYSEDVYPGGYFQYNKDPNNQIFVVRRFDREKGTIETVTGGAGGAVRPQLSHDGKTMAFVKRVRTKTVLYLRELSTGREWPIYDQLSKDQQEAWSIFGVYSGYSWSPDDKFIYIWANGKINKVDPNGFNKSSDVAFSCNVKQKIYDAVRFKQQLDPDKFSVNVVRQAISSPDGKMLVFNAVGYLWKKDLPNGIPQRLTKGKDFEFEPSFSADGNSLVYTTWNDEQAGALYVLNLKPGSQPVKISTEKAIYRNPSFSPDGRSIVFQKEDGSSAMGPAYTSQPGIYIIPTAGGASVFVHNKGYLARFNAKGDRLYYQVGGGMNIMYASCKTDGSDERTHLKSTYGSQFTVSPDGKWIAFVDLHKVYISAFPQTGKMIDLGSATTDFPVKQVAKDAGSNLHWSGNSKELHYTLGSQYYTVNVEDRFEFVAGKPDSLSKMPEKGIDVGLSVNSDRPQGTIAFTNARIITMKGNEVIENGTVLVEGNKIKAIGANLTVPAGTKIIDCNGKTIMPGIIDAHAHGGHFIACSAFCSEFCRNRGDRQTHWRRGFYVAFP